MSTTVVEPIRLLQPAECAHLVTLLSPRYPITVQGFRMEAIARARCLPAARGGRINLFSRESVEEFAREREARLDARRKSAGSVA